MATSVPGAPFKEPSIADMLAQSFVWLPPSSRVFCHCHKHLSLLTQSMSCCLFCVEAPLITMQGPCDFASASVLHVPSSLGLPLLVLATVLLAIFLLPAAFGSLRSNCESFVCRQSNCMSSPSSCWYHMSSHSKSLSTSVEVFVRTTLMLSITSLLRFIFSILTFLALFFHSQTLTSSPKYSALNVNPKPSLSQKLIMSCIIHLFAHSTLLFPDVPSSSTDNFRLFMCVLLLQLFRVKE